LVRDYPVRKFLLYAYMMTGGLGTAAGVLAARHVLGIGFARLDDAALVFPAAVFLIKVDCEKTCAEGEEVTQLLYIYIYI
jgi:hypothetical protein